MRRGPFASLSFVLCLLASGCDNEATAPSGVPREEAAVAQTETVPSAVAETAVDVTALREPGFLDGKWVAGTRGRYNLVIDVRGDRARVASLDDEVHWEGRFGVELVEANYARLFDAEDAEVEFHIFVRNRDELQAIVFGENGVATARRVHPMPEALLGDWTMGWASNYHLAGGTAEITSDSWRVRVGQSDVRSGSAYGLGAREGAVETALRTSDRYLELTRWVETPGGTWLGWIHATDQHMVLHREGQRPEWVPEPGARVRIPGR
jgi:hypothetical protein